MSDFWIGLRRAGWLWVLPLLAFIAALWPGGIVQQIGLVSYMLVAGAVPAVGWPAHPVRNGIIGGVVLYYIGGVLLFLIQGLLNDAGLVHNPPPAGESTFSQVIEAPFWLTVFLPAALVLVILGAALVVMWMRSRGVASS